MLSTTGSHQRLVTAHMAKLRGNSSAADVADPLATVSVSASGERQAVVECTLSPEHKEGAMRVAAFLVKYNGTANGVDLAEPLDTITTCDRLALVTVVIRGTPYVIIDHRTPHAQAAQALSPRASPPTTSSTAPSRAGHSATAPRSAWSTTV